MNCLYDSQIDGGGSFSGGCLEARGARIWIFVGFVLGFAAIIAAVWTVIAYFSEDGEYLFIGLLDDIDRVDFVAITRNANDGSHKCPL